MGNKKKLFEQTRKGMSKSFFRDLKCNIQCFLEAGDEVLSGLESLL